jgi:hypothetical protein
MKHMTLFIAFSSLFFLGIGCQNEFVKSAPEVSSPAQEDIPDIEEVAEVLPLTLEEVQDIFDLSVPENVWRIVDQWLVLDNGNLWVLTRQNGSMGDPPQINPCAQNSYCPVESWIVDPSTNKAYLTSSQNSYYTGIVVTPSQTMDGFIHLDWTITHLTSHSITGKEIFSEEFSREDGLIR